MKAMVYHEYGYPDVLRMQEFQKPRPGDDEVLIKVYAASINSWDWDLLRGTPLMNRIGGFFKPQYKILGCDIAGRVESVGRNITHFKPGDEVFGDLSRCGWGGFAEYVCASEDALAIKSKKMTFRQAAAFPQAAVLALQGLRYKRDIVSGQKILVNGAGGGAGTFAIQIAKSFGAEVTGVDSTEKMEIMKSLGADHVIDYTKEDFTKSSRLYDRIVDFAAYHSIFDYRRTLVPDGIYVMVGGSMSAFYQILLLGAWFSTTGNKKVGILLHKPNPIDLTFLKGLFDSGEVAPIIEKCYPLEELPEALKYFGTGHVKGKLVINVSYE